MKKRFVEAKETLRHMYAINCSQHADNWPVTMQVFFFIKSIKKFYVNINFYQLSISKSLDLFCYHFYYFFY